MDKKKITFILNPISGTHSKDEIPNMIEQTLDYDLFEPTIRFTEYAGHAAEMDMAVRGDVAYGLIGGNELYIGHNETNILIFLRYSIGICE